MINKMTWVPPKLGGGEGRKNEGIHLEAVSLDLIQLCKRAAWGLSKGNQPSVLENLTMLKKEYWKTGRFSHLHVAESGSQPLPCSHGNSPLGRRTYSSASGHMAQLRHPGGIAAAGNPGRARTWGTSPDWLMASDGQFRGRTLREVWHQQGENLSRGSKKVRGKPQRNSPACQNLGSCRDQDKSWGGIDFFFAQRDN